MRYTNITDYCPEICVGRGALMLDKILPDWWKHIDVRRIDLSSSEDCILAQLWPVIQTRTRAYRGLQTPFGASSAWVDCHAIERWDIDTHGFAVHSGWTEATHRELKKAWAFEIECRRAQANAKVIPVLHVVPEYVLTA
jgi:hypothetical protein